jgi:ferritin-like metal-binding protein YciE
MENHNERITRYMEDLHAAERGLMSILEGHLENKEAPSSIRQICSGVQAAAHGRMARLEIELDRRGHNPSSLKDMVNKAATKLSDLWNIGHDNTDKLTMDLIKAHAAAHLVHGSYHAFRAYSHSTGERIPAELAEEGARSSQESAESLLPAIQGVAGLVSGPAV